MQRPLAQSAWVLVSALSLWLAAPGQAAPIPEVGGPHAALMGSYDADTGDYWSVSYASLDNMLMYRGKVRGESFAHAVAANALAPGSVVYPAAPPARVRGAAVPEPSAALLSAVSLLAIHLRSRARRP